MDSRYYQHKDFYLCAYLLVQNCQLIRHERIGNSTTFTFHDSDELRQLVSDYYDMKAYVEAMAFTAAIRNLKTIIHSNRPSESSVLTSFSRELNHEFFNKHGEKI